MNSTETTPVPAARGRQIGQLLAGRYRLAMSKGGDDMADVWHAVDESTQKVVTLEILRERDNEGARQRFLAEARRMAAIERPSVMRVAAIHDEATDTFIVFEHLIPLPVVLTGLTAVAKDVRPATKAAEDSSPPSTLAAVAGPKRTAVATEAAVDAATPPTIVELDVPEASAPQLPGIESRVIALAERLIADARILVKDLQLDTLIADARARIPQRFDTSAATSLLTRTAARVRELAGVASSARSSSARAAAPVKEGAVTVGAAQPNITALLARVVSSAGPLLARVRGNRFALGGAGLLLLAVVVVASPLDDAIATAFRSAPAPSPTAVPQAALAPAPFALPPLSAYGATFESQGAYPTTTPNGTVEWVVALRNTGSVGWYRGIEGAQAALALPDGAGVAVQSTPYVAPGQVGWFVVHFRARAEPGTYNVQLLPRIDGRGPLQDLGIYAVVTVSKNP